MKKFDSLTYLINTLSKAEKKQFAISSSKGESTKDYLTLYNLITKSDSVNEESIVKEFRKTEKKASFEIAVHYLYEKILDSLVLLRKKKDIYYSLFQKLCKAELLYERSMFRECFDILNSVIEKARENQVYEILLMATKLELEYLLRLDFPNISEKELSQKHYQQTESINHIRKITEQASLYNLLKHRLTYKGDVRSRKQEQSLNDLMISEMYIATSSGNKESNFEMTKKHKLFQANYLMGIGDYSAALRSFRELSELFENNTQFWANPPIYYISVLEGILRSLRTMGNYEEMPYFAEKLKELSDNYSLEFKINTLCIAFQYELFPFFDKGDYAKCKEVITLYKDDLFNKDSWLNPIRKSELLLYTTLVYIGLEEYNRAKKTINSIIPEHNMEYLPIMKTIRLVKLIIYYELGDHDFVRHQSQSIRRGISLKKEQAFQTEHLILWYLNKVNLPVLSDERKKMLEKLDKKFKELHNDKYEKQLLSIFDFTIWIESKLLRKKISYILNAKNQL
ncbi:hypothetical protein [Dysgonomonas termitidis]|uniref:Tetratricopeptide repeat protein n=1 Tax=Dysgonomonas termitidis TaxID=1516126 RepID=A0ABV9L2T5_9BACT